MSTRQWIVVGISVAIFAQVLLLGGMVARAAYPLWAGQEVRVKTTPVDPRSLFRGNYARLGYSFSQVSRRIDQKAPDSYFRRNRLRSQIARRLRIAMIVIRRKVVVNTIGLAASESGLLKPRSKMW